MIIIQHWKFSLVLLLITSTCNNASSLEKPQKKNTAIPLTRSDENQVMFNKIGSLATDVQYHHIQIDVDCNHIFEDLKHFEESIYAHIKEIKLRGHTQNALYLEEIVEDTKELIDKTLTSIDNIFVNGILENGKRFVDLLVAFIGGLILGTASNIATIVVQGKIGTKLTQIEKMQNNLIALEDVHDGQLHKLDSQVHELSNLLGDELDRSPSIVQAAMDRAYFNAVRQTQILVDVAHSAQNNRLSHTLLTYEVLEKLFNATVKSATAKGYKSLINRPSDLYQVETSFLVFPNRQIVLIVHVPMVKFGHSLSLYQYIPTKLSQTFLRNNSITPVVGEKDLIAVGMTNGVQEYKIFAQSDLLHCLTLSDTYLCDGRNILQTEFQDACLSSLFKQILDGVLSQCEFEVNPSKETVYALSHDEFIVSSDVTIYTYVQCHDYSMNIHVGPLSKVKIEQGCKVPLNHHLLIPTNEFFTNLDIITYGWTWDAALLFKDMTSDTANDLINSLTAYGHHVMTVKDIQKWNMDSFDKSYLSQTSHTVIAIVLIAGIILACAVTVWFKCKKNKEATRRSMEQTDIPLGTLNNISAFQPTAPFISRI